MENAERVQVLKDLIKINSVNGNEIEVAQYLQDLFQKHGIEAHVEAFGDRRANLTVDFGTGDQVLGVTGHMDTVTVGDESKWHTGPFDPHRDGDRLYGRGAADMKSGLAAEVIALIELHDADQLPAGACPVYCNCGRRIWYARCQSLRSSWRGKRFGWLAGW